MRVVYVIAHNYPANLTGYVRRIDPLTTVHDWRAAIHLEKLAAAVNVACLLNATEMGQEFGGKFFAKPVEVW
jgi:hypothetical protein